METYMKKQGYNFYVYVAPGNISYFENYESAYDYADSVNCEVSQNI